MPLTEALKLHWKRYVWITAMWHSSQARSKQTSFGQAILYHSLVCVHAHNLGGSGGMGNFQNVHTLNTFLMRFVSEYSAK